MRHGGVEHGSIDAVYDYKSTVSLVVFVSRSKCVVQSLSCAPTVLSRCVPGSNGRTDPRPSGSGVVHAGHRAPALTRES